MTRLWHMWVQDMTSGCNKMWRIKSRLTCPIVVAAATSVFKEKKEKKSPSDGARTRGTSTPTDGCTHTDRRAPNLVTHLRTHALHLPWTRMNAHHTIRCERILQSQLILGTRQYPCMTSEARRYFLSLSLERWQASRYTWQGRSIAFPAPHDVTDILKPRTDEVLLSVCSFPSSVSSSPLFLSFLPISCFLCCRGSFGRGGGASRLFYVISTSLFYFFTSFLSLHLSLSFYILIPFFLV